jgi:acyl dehydratase
VHYDAVYAAAHPFGKRVAHGLLLAAMTALGGTTVSLQIEETLVAFLEQSTRLKKPALVGDTVKPYAEVVELVPKSGGRGLVRFRVTIENQDGEELLEGEHAYFIRSRHT